MTTEVLNISPGDDAHGGVQIDDRRHVFAKHVPRALERAYSGSLAAAGTTAVWAAGQMRQ